MRRKEFTIAEQAEMDAFLQEMTFGFMATVGEDGWPHIKALNFVCVDGALYFHGSKIGEKIEDLKADNRVTFSVAKEYSIIPSYFSDPKLACPATAFFKSVTMRGRAVIVEDLGEKARAFTAFMEKLQPEGGYEPIDPEDQEYANNLFGVALVKVEVEEWSAKFKFGQNLPEAKFGKLVSSLEGRGTELDQETIAMMEKYCPHHRKE